MADLLGIQVWPVDAVPGGARRAVIAQPGAMAIVRLGEGDQSRRVGALLARPVADIAASGEAERLLAATDVLGVEHRHGVRNVERLRVQTAQGALELTLRKPKDAADLLRRAAQRAFGFGLVPARPHADTLLGLRVEGHDEEGSVCGLIALPDGLRLFVLGAPDVGDRLRGLAVSAGSFALSVASAEGGGDALGSGSAGAGTTGPRAAYLERELSRLRKGREQARPPGPAGVGEGRVTAAVVHEGGAGPIRVEATVDGRLVVFDASRHPEARARLRHLLGGALGTKVRAA